MIQIYLSNLHSHEETDEVGADEPYVLATAVNLASVVNVAGFPVPLPALDVAKYGPFDDVDDEDTGLRARNLAVLLGCDRQTCGLKETRIKVFLW